MPANSAKSGGDHVNPRTPWADAPPAALRPKLAANLEVDAAIVGGGMTGVIAAYLLAKEGKTVALFEKNRLGEGGTALSAAFLTQSTDVSFAELIATFGRERARLAVQSHHRAMDDMDRIAASCRIECEFERCDNFIYANVGKSPDGLLREASAARRLGVEVVSSHDGADLGLAHGGYLRMPQQAKFHPIKFLRGVATHAESHGAKLFERSEVTSVTSDGAVATLAVGGHIVRAKWVLLATYEPFHEPLRAYFSRATQMTYMLEGKVLGVPSLRPGTYEDTELPRHFLRVDQRDRGVRILFGGESHRVTAAGKPLRRFADLAANLDRLIPSEHVTARGQWSRPILMSPDGLAFIGPIKEPNVIYATAFSGYGTTYAGIAATMFADWVAGRENIWRKIYDPKRVAAMKAVSVAAKKRKPKAKAKSRTKKSAAAR